MCAHLTFTTPSIAGDVFRTTIAFTPNVANLHPAAAEMVLHPIEHTDVSNA